jgi:hypothetical protein
VLEAEDEGRTGALEIEAVVVLDKEAVEVAE